MTVHGRDLIGKAARIVGQMTEAVEQAPVVPLSSLPSGETALVMIDMVNGFARHGALAGPRVAALIPNIARLQGHFLKHQMPVVALADTHPVDAAEFASYPPHCVVGTEESEVVAELKGLGGYTLIPKNSTNGFLEPAFQAWLAAHSTLRTFVLVGDCTDICVLQFALALKADANRQNRQVQVIVPAAAVDTFDAPGHDGDFMHLAGLAIMAGAGVQIVRDLV